MGLPPVKHDHDDHRGAFYMEKDGKRVATSSYSRAGDFLIIIDHTDVDDSMRGTGAGKELVMKAVEWARSNRVKILPLCPFAKSVFEKTPEIADVLR